MKKTIIISAKIEDEFMSSIKNGIKRYEIRDSSFENADAISYFSSNSGNYLGTYKIIDTFKLDRDHDYEAIKLSAVTVEQFYYLFPTLADRGPHILWVAKLGNPISLEKLVE
ncbi:MAG: hypothetical protein LKJ31_06325 [Atopobiaceae bacterium]|nr:hypothetical protein [Atopobiaceae bacterium]